MFPFRKKTPPPPSVPPEIPIGTAEGAPPQPVPETRRRKWARRISRGFAIFAVTFILLVGWHQGHDAGWWPNESSPVGIIWPLLAVAGFVLIARMKISPASTRSAAEKLARYGAMWQCLYAAAWLLAVGLLEGALLLGLLAVLGFTSMTFIKELGGLVTTPPRYRI